MKGKKTFGPNPQQKTVYVLITEYHGEGKRKYYGHMTVYGADLKEVQHVIEEALQKTFGRRQEKRI